MDIAKDIFGVEEGVQIWLRENGELLKENPFSVTKGKLFDRFDSIRDDILGKAIRGAVEPMRLSLGKIDKGEKYFYIKRNGDLVERESGDEIIDIFNIIIGNVFHVEAEAKEAKPRVLSTISGLAEIGLCLFPSGIGRPMPLASSILEITTKERIEDEEMHGVLRESFSDLEKE